MVRHCLKITHVLTKWSCRMHRSWLPPICQEKLPHVHDNPSTPDNTTESPQSLVTKHAFNRTKWCYFKSLCINSVCFKKPLWPIIIIIAQYPDTKTICVMVYLIFTVWIILGASPISKVNQLGIHLHTLLYLLIPWRNFCKLFSN